jgi:hypothetical protein
MNEQGDARGEPQLSEEQVRALEEELRKVRVEDLLLQSVASVINLTARRIGKQDERDLEQARVGIEAVRALVGLLPEEATAQVRDALSQLQMLYAQASEGEQPKPAPGEAAKAPGEAAPAPGSERPEQQQRPSEPPPRLWTPPGSG